MQSTFDFENEVRRVARVRWPSAESGGSELLKGKERDGVFITEECVHLLECTTSRELYKAKQDLGKLFDLYKDYRKSHSDRAVKCWFVTLHEPTVEQRNCRKDFKQAPDNLFNVVSYAQFLSKLVDSHEYLQAREAHRFGSIYDPKTGNTTVSIEYIAVGLRVSGEPTLTSVTSLSDRLQDGQYFTFLGEYGVGKSMTLRELFRTLADRHRQSKTPKFPVYLNLREHQGQHEPAEILERHARNIGFNSPSQLVRAWKAGFIILLIDGFDEVSSIGLQGAWRRLQDARLASMAGVKRLISDSPTGCGIAIAGRDNFFDTAQERRKALGQSVDWKEVRLDEFDESQISGLMKQFGFTGNVPHWIPSKPLLLATLFAKGLSAVASSSVVGLDDPAAGWDLLLNEVCNREARIECGISGDNVRAILESLATLARAKSGGLGPLTPDDILRIFQSECGFQAADEALIVLQRLPGLGRDQGEEGDLRAFVDLDFADACRAGDFVRFCQSHYGYTDLPTLAKATTAIGPTGIGIAFSKLTEMSFGEGALTAAIGALTKFGDGGATSADLVNVALRLALKITQNLRVSNLSIKTLEITSDCGDLSNVTFNGCFFERVELAGDIAAEMSPTFDECYIQELDGRVSENDLPNGRFNGSIIEFYSTPNSTNDGALQLAIPDGAKVLLTVLKKLFVQSVSGRKENALYRGLEPSLQGKVPLIVDLLKKHGWITSMGRMGEPVWIPVRRFRRRVLDILGGPSTVNDIVLTEARKL